MKHFKLSEFACPDCNENKIDYSFTSLLDSARSLAGIPFVITSGYRCEGHNAKVGGSATSSHLKGLAADIKCINSRSRFVIINALMKVGFDRFGISKDFIHVDLDSAKTSGLIWTY